MYDGEPVFAYHGDTRMLHGICFEKSAGGKEEPTVVISGGGVAIL